MKRNKKIDWGLVGWVAFIAVFALIMIICIVIKIWVFFEYGDMPITEVPTWAIPWLTN